MSPDSLVRQILDYLEPRIDPAHVAAAQARQRAALEYAETDRPPIVFYLPYEGERFQPYPYPEAYADPAKMMVNELLVGFTSLYHAVDLRDDAPYCVRPNLGTGIIASMFGGEIRLTDNNMPWVLPFADANALRRIVDEPLPDVRVALGQRVLDQYAYFDETLREYPACREAFQLTLPDLQGPFSTAEMLWGSPIYLAAYDDADFIRALLQAIAEQMVRVYRAISPFTRETLGEGCAYQHATGIKGRVLVRNDSMTNLSPRMYRDLVLPADAWIGQQVGSIGVHFCGYGGHQASNLLQIPEIGSLDLGNPEKNDLDALYAQAAPRRVALTRLRVPEADLSAARLKARFPCGVNIAVTVERVADAHRLFRQYDPRLVA